MIILRLFRILTLLVPFTSLLNFAQANPLNGFWEGVLTYQNSDLPVRIEIQVGERGVQGFLDLPSLVYAHQPLAILDGEKSEIIFEFPFGIGAIPALENKTGALVNRDGAISLVLRRTASPPYSKKDFSFGSFSPKLEGTLFVPTGKGPFPLVVLIAGSGTANRQNWSYASWADFYARQGIAAFIYDRRDEFYLKPDGTMLGMEDHAKELAEAFSFLRNFPEIDGSKIGVASNSRGGWIAMALNDLIPDLAFMIFLSPAPVTPAEQNIDSNLTGMDQDGLDWLDLAAARNYFRLYFYTARTGQGWDLLEPLIHEAQSTTWGQYVDQPRSLEDLKWWKANMDFPAQQILRSLKLPVLALWGEADFISPYAKYEELFRTNFQAGGNAKITTMVFPNADHRIEIDPGTDSQGNWHWFGVAPGALKAISEWIWDIIE